jgi:ribonuclease J
LDGSVVINADSPVLGDRRRASQQGFVTVSLTLDDKGYVAADPLIAVLGLPSKDQELLHDQILDAVEASVERLPAKRRRDDASVEEAVRIGIRRLCRKSLGKNPGVAVLTTRQEDIDF